MSMSNCGVGALKLVTVWRSFEAFRCTNVRLLVVLAYFTRVSVQLSIHSRTFEANYKSTWGRSDHADCDLYQ